MIFQGIKIGNHQADLEQISSDLFNDNSDLFFNFFFVVHFSITFIYLFI